MSRLATFALFSGLVLCFTGPFFDGNVHFNMGLHGWQKGRIKDGTFEPLTRAYVEIIRDKLPNAKIIWASSTPVTVKGKVDPVNIYEVRGLVRKTASIDTPTWDEVTGTSGIAPRPDTDT